MIDGRQLFDQPETNNVLTYDNIVEIATGNGDDYITGCLLEYPYFKNYFKMIAIDVRKQKARAADPKATQQINLTENLNK